MAFSDRLKELRRRHNMTQNDLAKATKISRSALGMYEAGHREPNFETLEILADYFNVDMNTLLNKTTPPNTAALRISKDERDLNKFLERAEVMFDGDTYKLTADDREKIRAALKLAFYDAKKRNRRKKD